MGRYSVNGAAKPTKRTANSASATSGKVPRAADFHTSDQGKPTAPMPRKLLSPLEIPKILQQRMGNPTQVIGFDIETHGWLKKDYGISRVGEFGWHTNQTEEKFDHARIVQLGWAVGLDAEKEDFVKARLVQPDGFVVTEEATEYHGIEHDTAARAGQPLRVVLQEFLADVVEIVERGGQVVAHHLEFDAGIILREFRRSHMHDQAKTWEKIAQKGFCTMSPGIGRSLKLACGEQISHADAKHTLALLDSLECLAPRVAALVKENRGKHSGNFASEPKRQRSGESGEDGRGDESEQTGRKLHDAGVDADLCRVLYLALQQHAPHRPGCANPPGTTISASLTNVE